jgi:hypothetical protein
MRKPPAVNWTVAPASTNLVGDDVAPPASATLLQAADQAVIDVAAMLYPPCAHMCDAQTDERRFHVVVPVGCTHGHVIITRAKRDDFQTKGTSQLQPTLFANTASGGFTGAAVISVGDPSDNQAEYCDVGSAQPTKIFIVPSSQTPDDVPTTSVDRAIELTSSKGKPSVELCSIQYAAGWTVAVHERVADMELL